VSLLQRFGLAVPVLLVAGGCGPTNPQTFPASGKVTYRDATLQSGEVRFMPEGGGQPASGKIQADGTFKLGTFAPDDGALPGKYKVLVEVFPEGEDAGLPGQEFGKKKPPIPTKYTSDKTSGLEFEIKSGENNIELKLVD